MSTFTLFNTLILFTRAEQNPKFYSFQGFIRNGFWLRAPLYMLNFAITYLYFNHYSYIDDAVDLNTDPYKPKYTPRFTRADKAQVYTITSTISFLSSIVLCLFYLPAPLYSPFLSKLALSTYIPFIPPKVELSALLLASQAVNIHFNHQYILSPQSTSEVAKMKYDRKFLLIAFLGTIVDCAAVWSKKCTMIQSAVLSTILTLTIDSLVTTYLINYPEPHQPEKKIPNPYHKHAVNATILAAIEANSNVPPPLYSDK